MRIWDVQAGQLCRNHLLGEHRELHGLWNIITKHGGKGGYSNHPETKRWIGKTKALYNRHQSLVDEMMRRGYNHVSVLDKRLAVGMATQITFINTLEEQKSLLLAKGCECRLTESLN